MSFILVSNFAGRKVVIWCFEKMLDPIFRSRHLLIGMKSTQIVRWFQELNFQLPRILWTINGKLWCTRHIAEHIRAIENLEEVMAITVRAATYYKRLWICTKLCVKVLTFPKWVDKVPLDLFWFCTCFPYNCFTPLLLFTFCTPWLVSPRNMKQGSYHLVRSLRTQAVSILIILIFIFA